VPDYRIYSLDNRGHVAGAPALISCNTDLEAIDLAAQVESESDLEVWEGARRVSYLPGRRRAKPTVRPAEAQRR
jgi:hypothetical protein